MESTSSKFLDARSPMLVLTGIVKNLIKKSLDVKKPIALAAICIQMDTNVFKIHCKWMPPVAPGLISIFLNCFIFKLIKDAQFKTTKENSHPTPT